MKLILAVASLSFIRNAGKSFCSAHPVNADAIRPSKAIALFTIASSTARYSRDQLENRNRRKPLRPSEIIEPLQCRNEIVQRRKVRVVIRVAEFSRRRA